MRGAMIALVLAVGAAASAACTSPEATRMRAGGAGADVGNHGRTVAMHEGSQPYHGTPRAIGKYGAGPLDAARQADRLSRPGADTPRR